MDSTVKGLELSNQLDGSSLKILIIHTRWNPKVVDSLVSGAIETLKANKVTDITIKNVAGAFELPFATKLFCGGYDACISIGCLIKGFGLSN